LQRLPRSKRARETPDEWKTHSTAAAAVATGIVTVTVIVIGEDGNPKSLRSKTRVTSRVRNVVSLQ